MARWIVIPVKAPAACKQRLRGALSDEACEALVARMLAHVVAVATAATAPDDLVAILGPSRHGLPMSTPLLADKGADLNAALASAADQAAQAGATRLVSISADLPHLTDDDIAALLAIDGDTIALAPDHHGFGTNALSLPMPVAREFGFAFGVDSRAAHTAAAQRLSLPAIEIARAGLARDLDLPEDLPVRPRLDGTAV